MNTDSIEHWEEWCELCALEKCGVAATSGLSAFAAKTFFTLSKKIAVPEKEKELDLPDRRPDGTFSGESASWHYVEERLLNGKHSRGKTYKAYIVDYALEQPPGRQLVALRNGFSLQARNVVREYYAAAVSQHHKKQALNLLELDRPLDEDGDMSYRDKDLPFLGVFSSTEHLNELEKEECRKIAAELAPKIWDGMDFREKTVLLAALLGISLAAPQVEQVCGCKKSQVYAIYKTFHKRVEIQCGQMGLEEDESAILAVQLFMTLELEDRIKTWAESEKKAKALLSMAGEHDHEEQTAPY